MLIHVSDPVMDWQPTGSWNIPSCLMLSIETRFSSSCVGYLDLALIVVSAVAKRKPGKIQA